MAALGWCAWRIWTRRAQWRALPRFGPKTAALAAAAVAGEVPQALADRRAAGSASLAPAGDGLRALLRGDIDIEIWIEAVERANLYVVQRPYLIKHSLIRMRVLRIRMRINNENHV